MFYVYIIQSQKTGRYYVGQTQDINDRFHRHNAGTQAATKAHVPWALVRLETFPTRKLAYAREREIKAKKSRRYIEWLVNQPVVEPA